jgi:hypothetical protein
MVYFPMLVPGKALDRWLDEVAEDGGVAFDEEFVACVGVLR